MLVYLDCDPGIDDALALGYLLASDDVDLVLVGSVSGNVDAETGARNARGLLRLFGRSDIPVAVGAHDPLVGTYEHDAVHVHGEGGIGGVVLDDGGAAGSGTAGGAGAAALGSAAAELVALATAHPGEVHVLAIGPLTNLAHALELEPTLPSLVADVTIMGGAVLAPGNVTPVAEANIACDPEAAALVLAADWDVTLVPLDATMRQRFEASDLDALATSGRAPAEALATMLEVYHRFYERPFGRPSSALHDPLAAGVLTREAVVTRSARVTTVVDTTSGPGRGQTIADLRGMYHPSPAEHPGGTRIVLEVEAPFAPLLRRRLLSL